VWRDNNIPDVLILLPNLFPLFFGELPIRCTVCSFHKLQRIPHNVFVRRMRFLTTFGNTFPNRHKYKARLQSTLENPYKQKNYCNCNRKEKQKWNNPETSSLLPLPLCARRSLPRAKGLVFD
jgi:hypothetical protein